MYAFLIKARPSSPRVVTAAILLLTVIVVDLVMLWLLSCLIVVFKSNDIYTIKAFGRERGMYCQIVLVYQY